MSVVEETVSGNTQQPMPNQVQPMRSWSWSWPDLRVRFAIKGFEVSPELYAALSEPSAVVVYDSIQQEEP